MVISDQLRIAIRHSQMTQEELANESGVAQASISNFLAYKRGLTLETVDKLALALNLRLVMDLNERTDHAKA